MPKQDCLICATDEGLFLDFFTHGQVFRDIIENYLSVEVQKNKRPSTKICYKCAYELAECNKFVEKFHKVHDDKTKKSKPRGHCRLCSEPGKKGFIYELQKDTLTSVLSQIQDLFGHDLSSANKTLSVCLYCRYNLDVLSDLKKVASNSSTSVDPHSKLPKVTVNIIRRKTTSPPSPVLPDSAFANTSVSKLPPKESSKVSRSVSPTDRQCDECDTKIENGIDMYRFHKTGKKLCKDCWVAVDPAKPITRRKGKAADTSSTKLCTVVLKDVLINPPDEKSKRRNAISASKKEVDREDVIYIISDESDDDTPVKSKREAKRPSSENDTKSIKKTRRDSEFIPQRETRAMSVMSNVRTSKTSSRPTPKRRHSDNFEVPDPTPKRLKVKLQKAVNSPDVKIDDKKTTKTSVKSKAPGPAKSKTPKKPSTPTSASSNEQTPKKPSQRAKSHEDETEKADEGNRRSTRLRKPTKHWSETSESPGPSEEDTEESVSESGSNKKITKSVTLRAPSAEKKPKTPQTQQKKRGKATTNDGEDKNEKEIEGDEEQMDSDGENQSYTCTICNTEFENKVKGMTHELTHSKKLGVVLEKVSVSEAIEHAEKEEDDQQDISAEAVENEKTEDTSKTVDTLEATKDAETSRNDEKPDEKDAENAENAEEKEEPAVEDADKPKDSEEPSEVAKDVVGETETTDNEKTEKKDETEAEKLPEVEKPKENDEVLKSNEQDRAELSKDEDKVESDNTADKEKEKENADEKEESTADKEDALPQETIEKSSSPKPDSEKTVVDCQSLATPEEKNQEPEKGEKESVQNLTNGENKETSSAPPAEENKENKDSETAHEEETAAKVDDKSEERRKEDEKKTKSTEDLDKDTAQPEKPAGGQQNKENEDYETDEEKSPEAEPLSPPRQDSVPSEDDKQMSNGDHAEKTAEETNSESTEEVKELESKPEGDKSQETTEDTEGVTEVVDNPQPVRKEPAGEVNFDEASMDAIERQMETIVGKEVIDQTSVINTVSSINPVTIADNQEVS